MDSNTNQFPKTGKLFFLNNISCGEKTVAWASKHYPLLSSHQSLLTLLPIYTKTRVSSTMPINHFGYRRQPHFFLNNNWCNQQLMYGLQQIICKYGRVQPRTAELLPILHCINQYKQGKVRHSKLRVESQSLHDKSKINLISGWKISSLKNEFTLRTMEEQLSVQHFLTKHLYPYSRPWW